MLENKNIDDEIVILFDEKNGNPEVLEFLQPYNIKPNVQTWRSFDWSNNFAEWKNKLNSYCTGDYIFQLDADEMISVELIKGIHEIMDLNPEVDVIFVPRINTVEGLTEEHVKTWNWRVNEKGWVNFPDWQGRIYKQKMSWYGKVHERIVGGKYYSTFPTDEMYCIQHHKTIDKQEKQNNLYSTI